LTILTKKPRVTKYSTIWNLARNIMKFHLKPNKDNVASAAFQGVYFIRRYKLSQKAT